MIARLMQYFKETGQELKRVSWPTIAELKESTMVVMITVFVITVLLFAADKILDLGIKQLIALG